MIRIQQIQNREEIDRLTSYYTGAQESIFKELENSTDFGIKRRKAILREVDSILGKLSEQTKNWTNETLPLYYKEGYQLSTDLLNDAGKRTVFDFDAIDESAIEIIASDTFEDFGQNITGMRNSVRGLMSEAQKRLIREKIAEGRIGSKTRKEISKDILNALGDDFVGMKDKSGRTWKPDVYARMLARTKITETTNEGAMNKLAKDGYDLVIISNHNTGCSLCQPHEGKIFSISGKTKEYKGKRIRSIEYAKSNGLFHPNCEHRVLPFSESFERLSEKWKEYKQNKGFSEPPKGTKPTSDGMKDIKIRFPRNVEVNAKQYEKNLLDKHGMTYKTGTAKNKSGHFDFYNGEIYLSNKASNPDRTFAHEVGHVFDYLTGWNEKYQSIEDKIALTRGQRNLKHALSNQSKFRNLIIDENYSLTNQAREIINNRVQAAYDFTTEQVAQFISGDIVTVNEDGLRMRAPRSHLNYLAKTEEIFADAYAQYRIDPEGLKERAPDLYEYFNELITAINEG